MAIKASNQITITDITDAYSVFMDNDTYSFAGSDSGAIAGSCLTNITAICGTDSVTVNVTQANIKFYEQGSSTPMSSPPFTTTVTAGTGNLVSTVTFTASSGATLTTPIEAVIPINVDSAIEISKRFTLTVSKAGTDGTDGADGRGISSVTTYFTTNNSSTKPTASTSSPWSTTATAPTASNHYMWAFDHYVYTTGSPASSNSAVRLAAEYTDASKWIQGAGAPSATTVTSASKVGDQYLNTSNGDVYKCTAAGTPGTWSKTGSIKGNPGNPGAAGADAILLEISANGPTVFKKNTDNVKLTPIVRVAGSALTITAGANGGTVSIGGTTHYVRWYNGNTELTKANTANSVVAEKSSSNYTGNLTLYGAYVTNAALIECRLDTTAAS